MPRKHLTTWRGLMFLRGSLEPPVLMKGETTLAKDVFDSENVEKERIEGYLKEHGITFSDVETVVELVNSVSHDGLMRCLDYAKEKDRLVREAAVILCFMADVPYEFLWSRGFMNEYDARELLFKSGIDFYKGRE